MYGLVLIAVLAIMGGVIAYIGDRLGTKVGKRKLSIFGLRPKYTSIIVTIVTGILIAATTLGVMAGVSRDVRTALFGMKALKTELTNLSREVASQNIELAAARDELAAKNEEYTALTAKIKDTSVRLAAITQELTDVTAERDRTQAALSKVQAAYTAAQGNLADAEQQIQTLQATKQDLDTKVAALNAARTDLQADVDRLNQLTANLKQGLQFVREGSIVFRAGEVVSTAVVKGGQSSDAAAQALGGVVIGANHRLTDRLGVTDKNLEVLWISRNDFDQAVSLIAATSEDVIVRISAMSNTIYGEPVIGKIDLYPNRLIYAEDTTVKSQVVNGGNDAQQAEETVILFLQQVNAEAVKQGILPDPLQGTVGVMSGAELFDTVNKVRRFGGKVELTAITRADIHTVGPLNIEIQVRDIPDK